MSKRALRTLIVDDEPIARQVLAEELAAIDAVNVVGEAGNGDAALKHIRDLTPDLVFLDIQMPAMDGFEVVRRIDGPLPAFVFVTAYSEHALKAFEIGAADYLLKPIRQDRLRAAVERVKETRRQPRERAERVARTLSAAAREVSQPARRIVARRGRECYLLDPDEVYAFQADAEIVWVLTANKRCMATRTLREIGDRLQGTAFQRVHRGVIVNTDKIRKMSSLSSKRWLVTLTNGLEFTVSKRQAPLVRGFLQ